MPDFEKIVTDINLVLRLVFGQKTPSWISPTIGWLLIIGIVLCGFWGALFVLAKIKEIWIQNFLPLFYNQEEKQRSIRRRTFAEHIEHEIIRLGRLEDWKDYRFAELEAEVEAEGRQRSPGDIPFLRRMRSGLRREKSLANALALSDERLILVEGEPGSGKSVALRHVAQKMARKAKEAKNTKSIIPIYVTLKELERSNGEKVDRNLIEEFVLKSLKRINDRDVESFLDDEFHLGMRSGTWFFLFDSFDELPEVLSSTETDNIVKTYGNAIDDFLHGMNHCRGVIASRQFRGPMRSGWPQFRVLPLSEKRRLDLIRRANLKPKFESELIGQLPNTSQEIRSMASNPLFLTLLCEHMKNGYQFPKHTHIVFETYISSRLIRDEMRLQHRFNLDVTQTRVMAEDIAFCMTADNGLGLSPTRENLQSAMMRQNMGLSDQFDTILDALEYMKLARSEEAKGAFLSKQFTFSHRRFQEYFATCVVLREYSRVSPNVLLTDARWRETAVVICQTQPMNLLIPIMEQISQLLTQFCSSVPNLIDTLIECVIGKVSAPVANQQTTVKPFSWPPASLHVLGLLQDGFTSHTKDIPDSIRIQIGKLLLTAAETGTLSDKKWALEVSGPAPEFVLAHLLRTTFSSESQWVKNVAYRQAARLTNLSPSISQGIRTTLIYLATTSLLRREKRATEAHLARLSHPADFLAIMRILLWLPSIDFGLHLALSVVILSKLLQTNLLEPHEILMVFVSLSISYMLLRISTGRLSTIARFGTAITILALLLRCFIVFVLLSGWISGYSLLEEPSGSYIMLSSLLLVIYGTFAFWAAQTGKFVSLRWLPLLSLWPFLCLFDYVFMRLQQSLAIRKTTWNLSKRRAQTREHFTRFHAVFRIAQSFIAFIKHLLASIKRLPLTIKHLLASIKRLPLTIKHLLASIKRLLTIKHLLASIKRFFIKFIKVLVAVILVLLGVALLSLIVFAIFNNTHILLLLGSTIVIAISLTVAGLCLLMAFRWASDWIRWYKWLRKRPSLITCQELFDIASTYYNTLLCVRTIKFVRERHILMPTKETETSLGQITLDIEVRQLNSKKKGGNINKSVHTTNISGLKETETKSTSNILVSKANAEILDALYELLEDVHIALKDSSDI